MTVPASVSKWAHPPRSKAPRSSSSGPPGPCITPSTETCVVVASFMFAAPYLAVTFLVYPTEARIRPERPMSCAGLCLRHRGHPFGVPGEELALDSDELRDRLELGGSKDSVRRRRVADQRAVDRRSFAGDL